MADNFPSRIPLLWLLTPFIFGIIAGRIFPVEIHPVIYTVVIALSIASIASANQPLCFLYWPLPRSRSDLDRLQFQEFSGTVSHHEVRVRTSYGAPK